MKNSKMQFAALLLSTLCLLTGAYGQITGVTAGTDLTGGGTSGNVTLNLNTAKVPQLASANTFTGNQTVNGNLTATGNVNGSSFQIGGTAFAFGSDEYESAYLGFAGNATTTAYFNTASGFQALLANTAGQANTANGYAALIYNTTGQSNTAIGAAALNTNTTGTANTAIGAGAGYTSDSSNLTGSYNTALGYGTYLSTGTLTNATAIGANAIVTASNAMVLGSIKGVNNATASTNVGIGTTSPGAALEVDGSNQLDVFVKAPEAGVGAGMDFFTTGSGGLQWEILNTGSGASQGANKLNVRNVTAGADVLTILASGRVGIGTTAPDDLLSVNGSADKPGGGSWGTYSDGRLKNLDGSYSSGLSQILRINPIRYRYKADNAMGIRDTDEHIGVVAQEVQQVIPEAVTENSKGYLLVNNDPIIWSMLNAIKEQQEEIRALKSELSVTRQSLQEVQAEVGRTQPGLVAAK